MLDLASPFETQALHHRAGSPVRLVGRREHLAIRESIQRVPHERGSDAPSAEALRHNDEPDERLLEEAGIDDRVPENFTFRFRHPALAKDQGIRDALSAIRVSRPGTDGNDAR
ncbi:MAG TPA: hypothetical protein VHM48_13420 [Candidatus Limnocylindrales bacterium]|nr:hypothetical protein [Candidatus Limnocylindrales bacterium]